MRDQRDPDAIGRLIVVLVDAGTPALLAADLALHMVPASGPLPAPPALGNLMGTADLGGVLGAAQRVLRGEA